MTTNIDDPHVFRAPVTFEGDGAITPPANSRTVTANANVTLDEGDADGLVLISATTGSMTITRGTLPAGKMCTVLMTARSGGSYAATVRGGTVTLDAANERVVLMWDGTSLSHLALVGATFA